MKRHKVSICLKTLIFIFMSLIITTNFLPALASESPVHSEAPDSISFAADAIGIYLKKIANQELFVSKMQEIFDMNSYQVQAPPNTKGMKGK